MPHKPHGLQKLMPRLSAEFERDTSGCAKGGDSTTHPPRNPFIMAPVCSPPPRCACSPCPSGRLRGVASTNLASMAVRFEEDEGSAAMLSQTREMPMQAAKPWPKRESLHIHPF